MPELFQGGNHREEHGDLAVQPRAEDAHLAFEEAGVLEREADRAPSHERVGLAPTAEVGDGLVAAEVERPDRDGVVGGLGDDPAVIEVLFLLIGDVLVGQEEVFGAEEADPGGADRLRGPRVGDVVDVGQELDLTPSAEMAGWSGSGRAGP